MKRSRTTRKHVRMSTSLLVVAAMIAACGADGIQEAEEEAPAEIQEEAPEAAADGEEEEPPPAGDAEEYRELELTMAMIVGENHVFWPDAVEWFASELETRSGGAFRVDPFPAGQLGGAGEALDQLADGVAEISHTAMSYHPEQLPLNQAWMLPRGMSYDEAFHAAWTALQSDGILRDELLDAGCAPLVVNTTMETEIMTVGTPPSDVDALEGLVLRSVNPIMEYSLTQLGASPTTAAAPEMYESLQRGTLDGTMTFPAQAVGFSLQEVVEYQSVNSRLFISPGTITCLDVRIWDDLDDHEKDLIFEVSREASIRSQQAFASANESEFQTLLDAGVEAVEWTEEERAAAQSAMSGVSEWWIGQMEDAGMDPSDALDEIATAHDAAQGASDIWDVTASRPSR